MELKALRIALAEQLVTSIADELRVRGVSVDPLEFPEADTVAAGLATTYEISGKVFGGRASFSLTGKLDRIHVVWGPFYKPDAGLGYLTFTARSFDRLLRRLKKDTQKHTAGLFIGHRAVDAWFVWVWKNPQLHDKMRSFRAIKAGHTWVQIHKFMCSMPVSKRIQNLVNNPTSAEAKQFLSEYS